MRTIFFCALLLTFASCTSEKATIDKISVASAGCHGECSKFSIEIDSSLLIKYYGGDFSEKRGFYIGKIRQEVWDDLGKQLVVSNYLKMDSLYYKDNDYEDVEIIIHSGGVTKHIRGIITDIPPDLKSVYDKIFEIPKRFTLTHTSDTLRFETTFQHPLPKTAPKFPIERLKSN